MDDRAGSEQWLSAAECAGRLGLTVRALRLYERRGLIAPRRTEKGWRLYGADEIVRLHEILALKRLGLSLARIGALLKGKAVDLDRILAMQQSTLRELRAHADQSLSLIDAARTTLAAGRALSTHELINLVKETTMTNAVPDAIAWRRYEQARPRTERPIDPDTLKKYVGHYQLENGGVLAITTSEGRLFAQLTAERVHEIFLEAEHRFFYKILPAQITFSALPEGGANALVLHHNGVERTALRIDAAAVKSAEDYLAARIAANKPKRRVRTLYAARFSAFSRESLIAAG